MAQTPQEKDFIEEVIRLSEKHGLSISHEDSHGGFLIKAYSQDNIEQLRAANYTFIDHKFEHQQFWMR